MADTHGVNYEFVNGDIPDADIVSDFVAEADYVYHQALKAGLQLSV